MPWKRRFSWPRCRFILEGEHHIEELLAVTGLLHITDMPASTAGNTCFGNFVIGDGVIGCDVFGPDHAGYQQFPHFKVHAHFLSPL